MTSGSDEVTLAPPGDETLRPSALSSSGEARPPRDEVARGTVIGRYVVLERLGAGGMGVVYAAFDPELDRKIALKLVGGSGSEAAGTRLMREAQAMAKLDHEHVVAVHDVGRWGEQVFIAMEYLDGGTLGRWLREGPHPWRETLARLLRAGAGLAAAHEAGIVHRDFKPDNVLFGRDGRVRVVDFGLARALTGSQDPSPSTSVELGRGLESFDAHLTMTGARLGTPAYMSPEQHRGDAADERSDQFSFCVTAYEAFYGQLPFAGVTLTALASNVLEGLLREPPRSDVPPWVFALLVRGLHRDPAKRHPSMRALLDALAVDVDAQRRARLRTAAAATAVVAGLAGVWGIGALRQRPCREGPSKIAEVWSDGDRDAGRAAFGNAGAVGADSVWRETVEALDGYADAWVEMYGEACRATRIDGDQSAELLDRRMACLDRKRTQLRTVAALFADADRAVVDRAGVVIERLEPIADCADLETLVAAMPPPPPAIAERVAAVTQALDEIGTLRAAARFADAQQRIDGLIAEVDALDHPPLDTELLYARAAVASDTGRVDEAIALAYQAIAAAARSHHRRMAADNWISLALLVGVTLQDFARVEPILHAAQAAIVEAGDDSLRRARLLASWGTIELLREDFPAAEAKLNEAYDLFVGRKGAEDIDAIEVRHHLALVRHGQGRYDEAEALLLEVLDVTERHRGPEHPMVGEVVGNLARLHKVRGEYDKALLRYEQSLAILTKTVGPNHPVVATGHNSLANTLRILGRFDEAEQHLDAAAAIETRQFGEDSEAAAGNLHSRALLLLARGRREEALGKAERAVALWEKSLGSDHARIAYGLTTQGRILVELGRAAEAIGPLERALRLRAAPDSAPPAEHGATHLELARALWDGGGDRLRARTEAELARARFAEAKRADEIAEAVAWLEAHPSAP